MENSKKVLTEREFKSDEQCLQYLSQINVLLLLLLLLLNYWYKSIMKNTVGLMPADE